ncbi:recombinase family protein [Azospirillum thermophilum]|nr:recombinase family protein [Azospirillum thermophilum]
MGQDITRQAAVYARVSTERQADNDRVSLPDQIQRCKNRCLVDSFSISDELVFQDTTSGTKDETGRPGFAALLKAAEEGRFTRLYVLALDRLARDLVIGVKTLERLEQLGISFVSLQEPGVENVVVRNLLLTLAQEERRKIVSRTANGRSAARAKGRWTQGMVPFGYRLVDGVLQQDPDEAKVVRDIFNAVQAGKGRIAVAGQLNRDNILPPIVELRLPKRDRKARMRTNDPEIGGSWAGLSAFMEKEGAVYWADRPPAWNDSSLHHLIRNPAYHGETVSGQKLTVEPAPIISRDAWSRANEAMTGRHRKGSGEREERLLSGLVVCGCCGRGYAPFRSGRAGTFWYYRCQGRKVTTGCSNPNVRRDKLEQDVVTDVTKFLASRLNRKTFMDFLLGFGARKVEELRRQLDAAQDDLAQMERDHLALVDNAMAMRAAGLGDAAVKPLYDRINALMPAMGERRREVDRLVEELGQTRAQAVEDEREAEEVAFLAENSLFLTPDRPEAFERSLFVDPREVVLLAVKQITIKPDGTPKIDLNDDDDSLARIVRFLANSMLRIHRQLEQQADERQQQRGHTGDIGDHDQDLLDIVKAFVKEKKTMLLSDETDKPLA